MPSVNEVEDPAAVLAIPTEEDVETIDWLLRRAFNDIRRDYELVGANADKPYSPAEESVMTEGSLYQELIAQLNNQTEDDQ